MISRQCPICCPRPLTKVVTVWQSEKISYVSQPINNTSKFFTCSHSALVKSSEIESSLDKCQNDVNTVMERLHVSILLLLVLRCSGFLQVKNPLSVMLLQKQSMDLIKMNQSRLEEKLEQLMILPQQVRDAAQRHSAGGQDAFDLMRTGQQASSASPPF